MTAAVILLHGLRTSASMWRHQREALAADGIPVIAVDLPGHGTRLGERFSVDASLNAIGDAVGRATRETGAAPYLVGFSLGGYLAIEWVAAHPGRVAGLLAAGCGTTPPPVVMRVWRVLARVIGRMPDRGRRLNDAVVRLFVPPPGAEDVISGGVALDVMDDALIELSRLRPLERLRDIRIPVLFVNGRLDHVALQAGRFLAATPGARLVTVPGATHMVSLVRPDRFTEVLLEGYRAACGVPKRA